MKRNISIWVNNNPFCEATLEQRVRNEVWELKNHPHILIKGTGFLDGVEKIQIFINDILLKED